MSMFSKLSVPPALSARKPSSVPVPGVEADRQADLVGPVLEARLPDSVLVERSQLVCKAFELDGVDGRAMAGVEASAALEVELDLAAQDVGVPA
jgi:hypothetical protein